MSAGTISEDIVQSSRYNGGAILLLRVIVPSVVSDFWSLMVTLMVQCLSIVQCLSVVCNICTGTVAKRYVIWGRQWYR